MQEQLNLFDEDEFHQRQYAVIFCSNIMKDQFGVIWERQDIVKSYLTLEAAKILTAKLNKENFYNKKSYYRTIEMDGVNFLIRGDKGSEFMTGKQSDIYFFPFLIFFLVPIGTKAKSFIRLPNSILACSLVSSFSFVWIFSLIGFSILVKTIL